MDSLTQRHGTKGLKETPRNAGLHNVWISCKVSQRLNGLYAFNVLVSVAKSVVDMFQMRAHTAATAVEAWCAAAKYWYVALSYSRDAPF